MNENYQAIADALNRLFNGDASEPKTGFCLLVFGFDRPGIANYLSNADRDSMVQALRETADRIERQQDNPRTPGGEP